jgi:hypothetical protein
MSLSGTERCSRVAAGPTARAAPPHGQSRRRHCPGCGAQPWRHARRPITRLPQRANFPRFPGHEAWPPRLLRDFRALLMIAIVHDGLLSARH